MRLTQSFVTLLILLGLPGCLQRELTPLNPCTISGVKEVVKVSNVDNVDLLFVIDNSTSMQQEQMQLRSELPKLVEVLTSGDRDGDGSQDFPPVKSLHVGVVTSDMGVGGNTIGSCDEPLFGDDGALRTTSKDPGCVEAYPKFLEFSPGAAGNTEATSQFQCLSIQGLAGCGFEQQLEAALKAVTPSSSDIVFYDNSKGQADRANAGFLRDDSLLAVIMATDEEDCSASNPSELFNLESTVLVEPAPNLRCFRFKDQALHPVQRYVDGLLATRSSPDLFVFAGIVGIPVSNEGTPWDGQEFDAMLAHDKMQEEVDPNSSPLTLFTSCDVPGLGQAYPPRRIVEVAKGLADAESNAIIQSICQSSYAKAIDAILGKIADVLGGACLPRELTRDASGVVNCDVVETLPSGSTCSTVPGRLLIATEGDREICRVQQLPVLEDQLGGTEGWYYDDFSPDVLESCKAEVSAQRIAYAPGSEPITGTEVDLQCLQQVSNTSVETVVLGGGCEPATATDSPPTATTFCDEQTNTYQYACDSDAQCETADLKGWRCWTDRPNGPSYCINPTCAGG